jgi:hypothetical protein
LPNRAERGCECFGGKSCLNMAVVEFPIEVVDQRSRGRKTPYCLGERGRNSVDRASVGTRAKPVVARADIGKGHDLAQYGVGNFGHAVRDVVIDVRCEKLPFGVVELEICGCGETEVRYDELLAGRQDVVQVSVEVHQAMSTHLFGCTEQLMQNAFDRTGDLLFAERQLAIEPAA